MKNEKGQYIKGFNGKTGFKHSDESKKKMSLSHKGKITWMKGRKHTLETSEKMSNARRGKKLSEEHKRNIGLGGIGKKMSEEAKRKMSIGMKGIKKSPEHILKMSKEKSHKWKGGIDAGTRVKYAPRPKPEQCEVCGAMGIICYDHCHKTGRFRGWICKRCNFALGMVKDNIETLQALAEYLKNSNP